MEKLATLGYDDQINTEAVRYINDDFSIARIIEVNKNSYTVADGEHEMSGELSGKFMFDAENSTDYPTVGDWVAITIFDDNSLAIIHAVLPRKTVLKRKASGKRIAFQLIASNIDYGLIVQSATNRNPNLLDRYFVMLNESGIHPIVVFTKTDLLSSQDFSVLQETLKESRHDYMMISNINGEGIDTLIAMLIPGKTYCLLGQSGVGKTSLLNILLHENLFRVNDVREDGRGRHTTVRRQLIRLDSGSIFIDTPGIRELGNFSVEDGIDQTFQDIFSHASQCRYADCTHTHENGCAILEAVKNGEIEESRYKNYLKLKGESEFYEMSYLEKRKKDKTFGKMIKNYKKLRKNN